ncbi:hypothetical protein Poli38472_013600 [Pythium oligandrum]|uniref:IgA peptidase M64-domain-containing protein n=1 Tax=Pythium oligandrum TaxID=41045 RepID=A0A8K1CFB1_PYTOL|nr:hypothetical protein Poli38472_013600 [Pythium oligandrum]|eukprot:TMW61137.1 hypothetical protein Poli38472_013600 [Pythium oligandrum]
MRSPSALVLALLGLAAVTQAEDAPSQTLSIKVLLDERSTKCTLVTPLQTTQLHRGVKTLGDVFVQTKVRQNRVNVEEFKTLPRESQEQVWLEIFGAREEPIINELTARCPGGVVQAGPVDQEASTLAASPTIKKIVDSGDPANRIDVVFMGDGYTSSESSKLFSDMQRLTDDMFAGETFAQYLPLFNVWAVHQPSTESGIGVNGKAKNTAFGLYRDGTELRGVYTSKPSEARRVCALVGTNACDFPSIIGNDAYYGGLGGEFVISTSSPTSGTIVLRHEMGHNFGVVGEEYDGGQVYKGANSARSLSAITWKHWLTNPNNVREEKAALTYTNHMWYNLKGGAYKISFTASGSYKRWMGVFTISGAPKDSSISITLDGKPLAWKSSGLNDRSFYTYQNRTGGFTAGKHEIVVTGNGPFDGDIIQQLCSFDLNEYGDESTFMMDNEDAIGAYPTWDQSNTKTYRPNNERCLMRNMESTKFCSVCQENMWLKFFSRVQAIDNVTLSTDNKVATVNAIPLAQLRKDSDPFKQKFPALAAQEKYTVTWLKSGVEQTQFKDSFVANLTNVTGGAAGSWTVRVKFSTPAVRKDSSNLLQSEKTFTVKA